MLHVYAFKGVEAQVEFVYGDETSIVIVRVFGTLVRVNYNLAAIVIFVVVFVGVFILKIKNRVLKRWIFIDNNALYINETIIHVGR